MILRQSSLIDSGLDMQSKRVAQKPPLPRSMFENHAFLKFMTYPLFVLILKRQFMISVVRTVHEDASMKRWDAIFDADDFQSP